MDKDIKVGFDGKRAVSNFTGLGNYSRFVIANLKKYYPNNSYKIFTPKLPADSFSGGEYITKKGFKPLWRTLGITNDIKQENLDIYHGLSNEIPYNLNKTGVKSVVTIHDLIFLKYPEFYPLIDRKIYDIKARYACEKADRIVAVSECTKKDIVKEYNIDSDKIEVVYQGCNEIFKKEVSEAQKRAVTEKYKLPPQYILSVGSIEDRKNILLIVKALQEVPDIHFIAIGRKRKYAQKVEQFIQKNGLSERVHIMSDVPLIDLPAILQLSKIFIYPSLYEGFGIPIIEALNSGIPVIAATGSCLEEAGGPDSIYVNPHDEKELASQIKLLLSDNILYQTMSEKGRKYAERFSDEICTNRMLDVYKSLVAI